VTRNGAQWSEKAYHVDGCLMSGTISDEMIAAFTDSLSDCMNMAEAA
jgi:hypothetical protein